jgi:hypothetical protein
MKRWLPLLLLGFLPLSGRTAPAGQAAPITVAETAGERRFGYPVTARVPLPRGRLSDATHALLERDGKAVRGAQYDVVGRWPDGSVKWLEVSFNSSPGPLETERYALRFGPEVEGSSPGKGVVEETETAFTIRNTYRVPRAGSVFLDSVKYGTERLRAGATWQVSGERDLLPLAPGGACRLVSAGPVRVVVERSGAYRVAGKMLPYRLTMEQPDSKSWIDLNFRVEDPDAELREISVVMPYAVQKEPVRWDLGVGSWLYGTLRGDTQLLLDAPLGSPWSARTMARVTGSQGYARQTGARPHFEGWGHLIDGASGGPAVAFGSPDWTRTKNPLGGRVQLTADGVVALTWRLTGKGPHTVHALFHHVADPVPVSAVTSPYAMLHPLRVTLPAAWYRECGLPAPEVATAEK